MMLRGQQRQLLPSNAAIDASRLRPVLVTLDACLIGGRTMRLVASTRPGPNGEGQLMVTDRGVRKRSLHHFKALCDAARAHIHDSVNRQKCHGGGGNPRCDGHSCPIGWWHHNILRQLFCMPDR
ncbi:hypothetical protein SAMN05216338_104243 [Bradyrhizobium sp. Rc2d]|nr:hypothetical protein SAMN05216338_104243 [Bradyrhizobium sp. Rc2d]